MTIYLGGTIRKQLLDTQLKSLENEMGARNLNNEDIVDELIDKLRARVDDNSDQDFKKASTLLFAWIVNSNQKDYSDLLLGCSGIYRRWRISPFSAEH